MSIEEFVQVIEEGILEKLGKGYRTKMCRVLKENDEMHVGIAISQADSTVAPTIYVDKEYEAYLHGIRSISDIVNSVLKEYDRALSRPIQNIKVLDVRDFEKCRDKVCVFLVGKELNAELLKDTVHIDYLDFAIVFKLVLNHEGGDLATVRVSNFMLEGWDMDVNGLYPIALANTQRMFPAQIKNLDDILEERLPGFPRSGLPMYVATNSMYLSGANVILYPGVLKELGDIFDDDFCIIPSSRHEVIAVPVCTEMDLDGLREMVHSVNISDALKDGDVLTENVYRYSRESDELVIV